MNNEFDILKDKVFSLFTSLARENPAFSDAQMLVASSDAEATLKRSTVRKTIDSEWIDRIEAAIPYLDLVVRRPTSYIEDIDEVLPVELSRHISEKSIKHLAQHTNYIRSVEGDEVTPSKILNVYHDESFLTYENKFVNTLLTRLFAFIDKRYAEIKNTAGTEKNYLFEYSTGFEHADEGSSRTSAKIDLHIELTTPVESGISDADKKNNAAYAEMLARISRLHSTVLGYISSDFSRKLGKNYIRPPVIRTNAILKNKNLNVCLELWQYIESCEKIGYAVMQDDYHEMPSDEYIGALYSSVALQYLTFYNGVASEDANKRLLSEKHLSEMAPEFDRGSEQEDDDEYNVYDAEYKKLVPVSRLMNNTRKLSEGERQVREALDVAIAADRLIEKRRRDEEERIRKEEEAARRRAEAEERRRIAREEARLRREEEKRLAAEAEAKRLAEEAEAKRLAEIAAAERLAKAEAAKRRIAEEQAEARRRAEEEALRRLAARTKIIFADEVTDGRCIDGYKLVPYTRAQYLALSRKKKKKVLTDLRHIREASEARGESALPEERTARENEALRWEDSVKRERNSR